VQAVESDKENVEVPSTAAAAADDSMDADAEPEEEGAPEEEPRVSTPLKRKKDGAKVRPPLCLLEAHCLISLKRRSSFSDSRPA
jgi:hypothetical protein